MMEMKRYGPFPFMRYPTNLSGVQNCTDDVRNHFFESFFTAATITHFLPGVIFFFYAMHHFRVASRRHIKARLDHRENPAHVFWTNIPKLPGVSFEVVFKFGLPVFQFGSQIWWYTTHDNTEIFHGGAFNIKNVPSFEVGIFFSVVLVASGIVDLVNRYRPWLIPPHWINIFTGVMFLHVGCLFITHSLWKPSLLVFAGHSVIIPGPFIASLGFLLGAVWPHSWHLILVQCAGIAIWAGALFENFVLILRSFMIDFRAIHYGTPCRDFVEWQFSVENLEVVWYLYQIVIFTTFLSFTICYFLEVRRIDPDGRRHEKMALDNGYVKLEAKSLIRNDSFN